MAPLSSLSPTLTFSPETGIRHDTRWSWPSTTPNTKSGTSDSASRSPSMTRRGPVAADASTGNLSLAPGAGELAQESHNRWNLVSDGDDPIIGERPGSGSGWPTVDERLPVGATSGNSIRRLEIRDKPPSASVAARRRCADFTSAVMGEDYPGDRIFHNDFYKDGLDSWTQAYGLGRRTTSGSDST